MSKTLQKVVIEVGAEIDPAGAPGVKIQLPDAWAVLQPEGAREVAGALMDMADQVETARAELAELHH